MIQMASKCRVDISFATLINVAVLIKIGKNNVRTFNERRFEKKLCLI